MRFRRRSLAVVLLVLSLLLGTTAASAAPYASLTWVGDWGVTGTGDGQFVGPTDVAVDKWGNVYVAGGLDGDDRLQMFDSGGGFITSRSTDDDSQPLSSPQSVAVDRWGNVYVGEAGNGGRVHTFGSGLSDWNGYFNDTGPSAISNPTGIGASLDGLLYLTDPSLGNMQRWSVYKQFMGGTTPNGSPTTGLSVSHDGLRYTTTGVGTGIQESVLVYSAGGGFLDSWGGHGTAAGKFDVPYDIDVDPLGQSYVIERGGERGQVFTPGGTFLAQFGTGGTGDAQFFEPQGIGVGPDRTVYVADTGNDRISKWKVTTPTQLADVAGSDRIMTAVRASQKAYPDGAGSVIIATGYNWPDALGGAALAGVVDGPILLTRPGALPAEVRSEIVRLQADKAYVLGGPAAVSTAVFNAVKDASAKQIAERLGGADRYETADRIATEVIESNPDYDYTAFVCTGADFPDALAAAPIAAANGWPIYLTRPDSLPAGVRAAMLANNSHHGYIIGGTSAVNAPVAGMLNTAPFFGFARIGGANRYETAAVLANAGFGGMGMLWSRPAIATGENFPDALAGGALQGSDCSVLLLTRGGSLPSEAATAIAANKDAIYEMRFLGGTSVVSTNVRNQVRTLLGLAW